jgi:psp operon transcriptional activator
MAHSTTPSEPAVTPLGEAPLFAAMLAHVSDLAPLDRPVLIVGERGTGKELVAGRLAYLSRRWQRPFVKLNCAALSDTLLDSELFGHEAGAFTGAARRRAGRFEAADGGTLFLDEIGTASLAVQEKLLRVIEYGAFDRVGGNETLRVDVRVIAATNADLPKRAAEGRFRADLLDRLAFDVVAVPPLRDRPTDIELLATHFARRMSAELARPLFAGFAPAALAQLMAHDWPGNVRELRNAIERSLYRANPSAPLVQVIIDPFPPTRSEIPPTPPSPPPAPPSPPEIGDFAARMHDCAAAMLRAALTRTGFNQRHAASALGLSYDQFRHQLRVHAVPGKLHPRGKPAEPAPDELTRMQIQ